MIDSQTHEGMTPFHLAVASRYLNVVRLLIKMNCDVNILNHELCSPLYTAVVCDDIIVVNLLIQNGANINLVSCYHYTPLLEAVDKGSFEVVNILLKNGADVLCKDSYNRNAIFIAAQNGHYEILKLILEIIVDRTDKMGIINCQTSDGATPLFIAAQYNFVKCVKELLKWKADSNIKGYDGSLPLHMACLKENKDCIKCLLPPVSNIIGLQSKDVINIFLFLIDHYKDSSINILLSNYHFSLENFLIDINLHLQLEEIIYDYTQQGIYFFSPLSYSIFEKKITIFQSFFEYDESSTCSYVSSSQIIDHLAASILSSSNIPFKYIRTLLSTIKLVNPAYLIYMLPVFTWCNSTTFDVIFDFIKIGYLDPDLPIDHYFGEITHKPDIDYARFTRTKDRRTLLDHSRDYLENHVNTKEPEVTNTSANNFKSIMQNYYGRAYPIMLKFSTRSCNYPRADLLIDSNTAYDGSLEPKNIANLQHMCRLRLRRWYLFSPPNSSIKLEYIHLCMPQYSWDDHIIEDASSSLHCLPQVIKNYIAFKDCRI
ncbi:inversin-like isoform X2 [Gordionus sp. m RMFG-2023]